MSSEAIQWEVKEGIGRVTLNRPEKRNAINDEVLHGLSKAVSELSLNPVAPTGHHHQQPRWRRHWRFRHPRAGDPGHGPSRRGVGNVHDDEQQLGVQPRGQGLQDHRRPRPQARGIASKGGNFLLNVGPTAQGVFPPESIDRLQGIGRWMQANGESIYATAASPLAAPTWGRVTSSVPTPSNTRLYLHVIDWPRDGRVAVSGLLNGAR